MAKEKNGFKGEYNYYVGVLTHKNELRFVDSVSYADKTATWNAGAKPKVFTKQMAIDLQMGLMCNGTVALVIEAPEFLELRNQTQYMDTDEVYRELKERVKQAKTEEDLTAVYDSLEDAIRGDAVTASQADELDLLLQQRADEIGGEA